MIVKLPKIKYYFETFGARNCHFDMKVFFVSQCLQRINSKEFGFQMDRMRENVSTVMFLLNFFCETVRRKKFIFGIKIISKAQMGSDRLYFLIEILNIVMKIIFFTSVLHTISPTFAPNLLKNAIEFKYQKLLLVIKIKVKKKNILPFAVQKTKLNILNPYFSTYYLTKFRFLWGLYLC